MEGRNYLVVSSVIFGIVALLHLWRAVSSLPLMVGVWELPVWLSWVAFVLIGMMSVWGFRLSRN